MYNPKIIVIFNNLYRELALGNVLKSANTLVENWRLVDLATGRVDL